MSVPYERLGPGQSGRLVYQVMGLNGPISNPAGIRYLGPDQYQSVTAASGGLPSLDTALAAAQIATVGLGLANLGMSALILREVHRLSEKVDRLQAGLDRVEGKIDALLSKVQRIDVNVAENNLRSALRHVLGHAIQGDYVDLEQVCQIQGDLEKFSESLDVPLLWGANPGLRLSSDVRDMASAMYRLLRGARLQVLRDYNNLVAGSPSLVWSEDLFQQLLRPRSGPVMVDLMLRGLLPEVAEFVKNDIAERAFFGKSSIDVIDEYFEQAVPEKVDQAFAICTQPENAMADLLARHRDTSPKRLGPALLEIGQEDHDIAVEILTEADELVESYIASWSMTDAALLLNFQRETALHTDPTTIWDEISRRVARLTSGRAAPPQMTYELLPEWVEYEASLLEPAQT